MTVLIYYLLYENKWYFILSELGIILSLWLSYKIYQSFIRPIELMRTGVNAIKDEDYNVRFLKTKSSEINGLIEVFNSMLDRLSKEKVRTQEQAYFLESIISHSPIGMIIMGYEGEITSINEAAAEYLNIKNIDDELFLNDLSHPLAQYLNSLETGISKIFSHDGIQKFRCQISQVIHKGFKRKFVVIEELSEELLKSEKDAYGKVIRMMAHEVNNSMGAINSILHSIVTFAFEDDDSKKEYVDSLNLAIQRNEDLSQFMKNFADVIRLPQPVQKPVDLTELVKYAVQMMTPIANENDIEMEVSYPAEECILNLDANLMQQVFVNILKNAMESIGDHGIVKCKVQAVRPQVIISDNGKGISDEIKEQLFSPFFSTKPNGQGIGLIVIRDILMGHDAQFSLETDRNTSWTHFSISF